MAARIGSQGAQAQLSSVGVPVDNRRDMSRELMAAALVAQLSAIEGVLQQIVLTGEKTTDRKSAREAVAARVPTSGDVQRALQNLQKDHGLIVTGRFDQATAALLQRLGLVPVLSPTTTAAAGAPTTPATTAPPTSTPTSTPTPTTPAASSTAPERKPVDVAARGQARQAVEARDAQLKSQFTARGFSSAPSSSASSSSALSSAASSKPLDRALDPARLLASLVAGGINAQQPPQALAAFQGLVGLPVSGQLDPRTLQALVATKLVSPEAAAAHTSSSQSSSSSSSSSAPPAKAASTTSAAAATTTRAVKETTSTTTGSGASTSAAVTRAPAASPQAAREQARLESLLAQAAAVDRGVQANTGDPSALLGHGEEAGLTTGLTGSGGSAGGVDGTGTEAALVVTAGPAGLESSVGNQEAGDDDHSNRARGDAVAAHADEEEEAEEGVVGEGHHKIEKLSVQVVFALKEIVRLDDGTVPVHYSWDVTLYRPGVYADGQPAEAVWHLVVERAHAFDAVWSTAAQAIAARLLAIEPEADPPVLDEILGALRQARVR